LGRFGSIDAERTQRALDLTGMSAFADRLVDTLSGGERQRAWLAMLVAQDASCLLLDEPIAALDVSHQIDVLSLVRSLSREADISVVLVLHDINMAARFCDEIVALHSGRLIARGSPDEIMDADVLRDIYGIDMDVLPHPASGRLIALPR
ncbi:ATP-binding cassette domain-containing protein, partial [Rhizobiaceae sp. 2RAB30]